MEKKKKSKFNITAGINGVLKVTFWFVVAGFVFGMVLYDRPLNPVQMTVLNPMWILFTTYVFFFEGRMYAKRQAESDSDS